MYFSSSITKTIQQNQRRTMMLILATLVALTVVLTASATPALAQSPSSTSWDLAYEFRISFPNDTIDAQLILKVQLHDGKQSIVLSDSYDVYCEDSGNLVIANEVAHFVSADQTYIKCQWPSLQEKAFDLSRGLIKLPNPASFSSPGIAAHVSTTSVSSTHPNTLYYHPDRVFSIPYAGASEGSALAFEYTGSSTVKSPSSVFNSNGMMAVWAGTQPGTVIDKWNSSDFNSSIWYQFMSVHGDMTLSTSLYWADGMQIDSTPGTVGTVSATDEVTIFIGYNPVTDTYFDGDLERLSDDPHWSHCC